MTSGYSFDLRSCLPQPHRLLCLPLLMVLSSSFSPASIVPCAWRPVEVLYLSMKRLVMKQRQENLSPWHWMLRWRLHEVHGPEAMINVKCNKRPVNKIEHCQSHSLLASQAECSVSLCVHICVNVESSYKMQWFLNFMDTVYVIKAVRSSSLQGFYLTAM